MNYLKSFAAAAVLCALSPVALAQVNDQGADDIRRALKVWIGQNLQNPAYQIELDRQITVLPEASQYRVTLPSGRMTMPGEGTLHFGQIKIDLTPMDNGWFDASWRLPDSYRIEPDHGSDVLITIGSQSARGVFAPEYQTMMSLDGELGEIEVTEAGDDGRLTIDRFTAVVRSTEVSQGTYDAQANYSLGRLAFSESGGRNMFELRDLEIAASSDDARLAELAEFQRRANSLTMELEGVESSDQAMAHIESFAELIESMPTLFTGMSFVASHGPITVSDHGDQVTVDDGAFSMSLDGLDQDRGQFVVAMNSNGVGTSDPEIARLLPSEARFRIAVIDLPTSELVKLGIGALRSMGTTDPEMAMLMATGGAQQALSAANSTLQIGPIRFASEVGSIDLEGALRPETSSPFGVVGEIDMVATGLDALIVEIQQSGGDQDAVQFLTLLQTLGAQAPDADGRSVRTYAFRLGAGGTMLLNGSDIMPLISGMQ